MVQHTQFYEISISYAQPLKEKILDESATDFLINEQDPREICDWLA